jgi:hypothetical protein
MAISSLPVFFERELLKLKDELVAYTDETQLWEIKSGISNSAGNLCLHLIGNLNHFIGATLGNTGYVRDRDAEFAQKNIPCHQLLSDIDQVIVTVKNTLASLPASAYEKDFPLLVNNKVVSTEFMVLNLLAHLSYHLGQINYHRRLM